MSEDLSSELQEFFDADPYSFIILIVNELRQEMLGVKASTEILSRDENIQNILINAKDVVTKKHLSIKDVTERISQRLDRLEKLLNTSIKYTSLKSPPKT